MFFHPPAGPPKKLPASLWTKKEMEWAQRSNADVRWAPRMSHIEPFPFALNLSRPFHTTAYIHLSFSLSSLALLKSVILKSILVQVMFLHEQENGTDFYVHRYR